LIFQNWGATQEEIAGSVVGDHLCPNARVIATRCITLPTQPNQVFPWIRQMGFRRAGWYSYDFIDNLGRKSATTIHDEWQDVVAGSRIPAGPISFLAAIVEPQHAFVLAMDSPGPVGKRLCFTLAYELRPHHDGTRLVTRMRSRVNLPGGALVDRLILGPGDGIMMRRQLLNLASRIDH
jgi:hypothetical protein